MQSRLYCGDNLSLLPTLPEGCMQLIYIDPPYGSGNQYAGYYDDRWFHRRAYLEFLRPRLAHMHRIVSPNGSSFVHLDQRASHYVKVELYELFGEAQFRGEIVWLKVRVKKAQAAGFPRVHDTLLWYSRTS